MNQLEPCPRCHRHVKVSEAACPFCASPLATAFASRALRAAPRARLGRAATFAFGVVAMTQGACGDNETVTPPADATSMPSDADLDAAVPPDADYDGGDVPIYAAAPTPHGDTTSRG
ncbi:MAG TPA: hypothetical protein VFS15_14740 [Kofleriaceae bacterium]|nr:hypothetical protein [Kofleriaceae bacterium]